MLYIHKNPSPNWHLYYDLRNHPETKTVCREQFSTEYFSFRKTYSELSRGNIPAQNMHRMIQP